MTSLHCLEHGVLFKKLLGRLHPIAVVVIVDASIPTPPTAPKLANTNCRTWTALPLHFLSPPLPKSQHWHNGILIGVLPELERNLVGTGVWSAEFSARTHWSAEFIDTEFCHSSPNIFSATHNNGPVWISGLELELAFWSSSNSEISKKKG